MDHTSARRRTALVALVLALPLALAGCIPTIGDAVGGSQGGGQSGGGGEETAAPTAPEPEEDVEEEEPETTTPEVIDLTELPASFPSDAVPLADGSIDLAVEFGSGWTVMLLVDDADAAFAQASQRIQSTGFWVLAEQVSAGGSVGSYTDDEYDVQVTAAESDGEPRLTYLVTLHP